MLYVINETSKRRDDDGKSMKIDDFFLRQQRQRTTPSFYYYLIVIIISLYRFDRIASFCQRYTRKYHHITYQNQYISSITTSSTSSKLFGSKSSNENNNMTSTTSTTTTTTDVVNPLSRWGLPEPLLLGSASFTRKLILKEMGVPYSKFVRPIDEKALGNRSENAPPKELVLLLANAKMDRLVQELTSSSVRPDDLPEKKKKNTQSNEEDCWVVLTGDQVVTCGGAILEKPDSVEEAKEFVTGYATSPPSTVGSCVLYHHPSGIRVSGVDTATIHFKSDTLGVNDAASILIDSLIEHGEPVMSCAGGLMIEHPLVQNHVDRIDGTEDSVMGLSKDLVLRLLEELAEKLKLQQQENNK
ncbi:MAG: septum formation protein [Bacillariaceae sp.]